MVNLRQRAEKDLGITLEKEFGARIVLIDPDGTTHDTSVNSGLPLTGQVLSDSISFNPETGDQIISPNPIATLRRSSLARVPEPGEKWIVKIQTSPGEGSPFFDFMIDPTKSPEGGRTIGFIRLYLRFAEQS